MLPAAQPLLLFHQAGGSGSPHGSGQAVPASAGHVSGPPERGGDRHRRQDARCGPDRDPDPVRTFKTFTDDLGGDVPAHVANGRALLINDYAASPVPARAPSLVAVAECAA